MTALDAIVIGAGHNGLICATYLAKAGKKVAIVEANDQSGGMAAQRAFHSGFQVPMAHGAASFSRRVIADLNLQSYGLDFGAALPTVGLGEDGSHVHVRGDQVDGATDADKAAYGAYRARLLRFASVVTPIWQATLPRIGASSLKDALIYAKGALKMRMLGNEDMGEFLRIISLPMRDLVDEVFEDPKLQAVLSWDGLIGSKMAPRSPNNAVLPLLLRMNGVHAGDHAVPKGGMKALGAALEAAAKASGVDIQLGKRVANILVDGDENGQRATGVTLEDGTTLTAKKVISSADPKTTFMQLAGAQHFDVEFVGRINRLRADGYVARFHAALQSLPAIPGLDDLSGRMIIAPTFDAIEFAYDDSKYGEASATPVIELTFPTVHDPALAPDGQHVLSCNVMYAPFKERSGWSDEARARFQKAIVGTLEKHIPGLSALIIGQELLTPSDLASQYHVYGGHWHHGEMAIDQMLMMRPTYPAAQYATPIPGLYLCGAGAHPGGGLTGLPGRNAARQILK